MSKVNEGQQKRKKRLVGIGIYYVYLLLVWGGIRYGLRFPDVIEELWFKPVIWLVPLFWWRLGWKGRPELFSGNWWLSGKLGLLVGVVYFVLIRWLGGVSSLSWGWDILGVALVTAIVEELAFSGFLLGIVDEVRGRRVLNILVVSLMMVGVHLPINMWVLGLRGGELLGVLLWLFCVAVINGWVRQKSRNVFGSLVARFILMLAVLG